MLRVVTQTERALMPRKGPNRNWRDGAENGAIAVPVSRSDYDRTGFRTERTMAQPAFLAQLFGERLRRRRLRLAREQAQSIHRAYSREGVKEKDGARIDVSI